MSYRNDPSSLSFGARLRRAETDAASAKAELAELKQTLPKSKDLQAAALTADVIKQQRKSAKQTIARADVTLDELNGIDASVLTPTYKEQLRLVKRDTAWRELAPHQQSFQFQTPQAQARFQNWSTALPQQDFTNNNLLPGEQKAQRPFDLWSSRQDLPEGRFHHNKAQQQELNRDVMIRRAEADRSKSGKRLPEGGVDMTNGTRT